MTGSRWSAVAIVLGIAVLPSQAVAAGTGGTSVERPAIEQVVCVATVAQPCWSQQALAPGSTAKVQGRALRGSESLVFRGKRGKRDDVTAAARHVRAAHFEATVPPAARSGRVDVIGESGSRIARTTMRIATAPPITVDGATAFYAEGDTRPSVTFTASRPGAVPIRVLRAGDGAVVREWDVDAVAGSNTVTWSGQAEDGPAPSGRYRFEVGAAVASSVTAEDAEFVLLDHLFPIRGKHDLGQSETNNFGGGRGHKGQDMFADCGTPVVAARGGRVRFAAYQAAAGNYVVITSKSTGLDYVYMHMKSAPMVERGQKVATGQQLGQVGETGRASGCQLHFELWSKPGWYSGGAAFDPLPRLKAWDGWS